ncbi:hypothetical protein M0Q97_08650 [Candidatus Dojkabacteria bacterium]|jgi:hypothetical protein|nr:hypothetical protein [Candidatus Dojkabacteria bacterium]
MKITFDEFIKEDLEKFFDEDIEDEEEFFDDPGKIKYELTKNFGRSFGNNADWYGTVWSVLYINENDAFYIYYGDDDDIELINRKFDPIKEENIDTTIFTVTDRESFEELIKIAKDKDKLKMMQKINKYNV